MAAVMATDTASDGEKTRLKTLPAELLIQVATHLTSKQDVANLRLTCHRLHNPATEAYVELCSKQETLAVSRPVVAVAIASYQANPWKAQYVSSVFLQFPDSRDADRVFKEARERLQNFEASNPSPERSEVRLPALRKDLEKREAELQVVRYLESEPTSLPTLLALLPKPTTLILGGLTPSSLRAKLPGTRLCNAPDTFSETITTLYLSNCQLSSGHFRLLLSSFPFLRRLVIGPCDITDGWASVLTQIYVYAGPLQQLDILLPLMYPPGLSFLPPGVTRYHDRELQTKHRTRQTNTVRSGQILADGPLAVESALGYVLKLCLGGEEAFKEAMEEARVEKNREEGFERDWMTELDLENS